MQARSVDDKSGAKKMNDQRWKELCRLIMLEQDPQRLLQLVSELNQEFENREMKLRSQEKSEQSELVNPPESEPTPGPPEESA